MDISIKCQLSLSKKLRAIIQEGETRVTLIASNITDGRGEAKLVISSDKNINKNMSDFFGKETSIMLIPIELEEVTVDSDVVGSIFNKTARKSNVQAQPLSVAKSQKRTIIDKIAVTELPEDGGEGYAVKNQEELEEEIPQQFVDTKIPAYKKFISNMDELNEALNIAKNKISDIDPDSYQDRRKRAEAIEMKEKLEAIDQDAYIVCDKCASLAINDLGINLSLNIPYNLANISAKRILYSKDLKSMFKANLVKFIKPSEIQEYVKRAEQIIESSDLSIGVYSSPEEAGDHMERSGMKVEQMDIGDFNAPTENEILLTNLTSRPMVRQGGVTKTMHGNSSVKQFRSATQEQTENSKGLKTIKRTGLQY